MRAFKGVTFVLTIALLSTCAVAQERNKGIIVNDAEKQPGVDAVLELKAKTRSIDQEFKAICTQTCGTAGAAAKLALETNVEICFKVTSEGYVTLWSIDSKGGFTLIYPNRLSHPTKARAALVKANTRTCVGDSEKYQLQIAEPKGTSKVYLHWTRTEDDALGPEDYPVIGKDIRAGAPPYAAATLQYEITGKN
ncbi:DUF4384 domain-containing protein [Bradyrhizobium sp. 21]|uniref:DUF4384 domain-containing protein n=1 Tax=Bradyrhizobium sp. 21 TaxID=2782666 RepID=UPI001FF86D7D|nr:DUF4384 domain-containing protein [Bradyrhizobium sp. 21]MCK1389029.1 DUF4384 domain-containing protein [Bradyrhizobium sp. 21]